MWDEDDGRPVAHSIVFWAVVIGALGAMASIGLVLHGYLQ